MAEGEAEQERLVGRARLGDRAAFDELTIGLAEPLLRKIRRRLGSDLREILDPEDVLQETFLRAFASIGEFRWQGAESFGRWIEGIAFHFLLHSARKHGRRKVLRVERGRRVPEGDPGSTAGAGALADGPSPSHLQRREERFERLKKAIEDLSPEYRAVVRLSRIEGLKNAEIAEKLGRSPASVRNLLFRAMKQLRRTFGDTESLSLPDRRLEEKGAAGGD
jgi:RNA polymerase sigma-70 factor (ECF subfamily)